MNEIEEATIIIDDGPHEIRIAPIDRVLLMDDHPALKRPSDAISDFQTPSLVALADELRGIVRQRRAWGIAAVQIGVHLRMIVVRDVEGTGELIVMCNPEITRTLNRNAPPFREGCLSVSPNRWRYVERPAKCDVRYQDLTGEFHNRAFRGKNAMIVQHEIDHLHGILITDKPMVWGL